MTENDEIMSAVSDVIWGRKARICARLDRTQHEIVAYIRRTDDMWICGSRQSDNPREVYFMLVGLSFAGYAITAEG